MNTKIYMQYQKHVQGTDSQLHLQQSDNHYKTEGVMVLTPQVQYQMLHLNIDHMYANVLSTEACCLVTKYARNLGQINW